MKTIDRADAAIGNAVESLVRSHHRRRLRRLGWLKALEPSPRLWADGEPAPRRGNEVEILIDGANFLPRIAGELERAESHVEIAGWYVSTELALVRGLDSHGFRDAFRALHGPERRELSWEWPTWGGGYRLDHLIVSAEVTPCEVGYVHDWRHERLSDHSALVAQLDWEKTG